MPDLVRVWLTLTVGEEDSVGLWLLVRVPLPVELGDMDRLRVTVELGHTLPVEVWQLLTVLQGLRLPEGELDREPEVQLL